MRVRRGLGAVLGAALLAAGVGACSGSDQGQPAGPSWQRTDLPAPSGERAMVRAATWCAGEWVVVGGTVDASGRTRPAVWASADAKVWESLRLHPGSDYYAAREILSSVACSHGRLALLGARSGGAHGIPRRATWVQRADGSLAAVRASYLLYGGTASVAVTRLVGGPDGFLIAGTRSSGAAVWQSSTGASFRLYDDAPGLASTSRVLTQALDALPYGHGWLVAGNATEPDGRLRAITWTGDRAGPWSRLGPPGGSTISTADRLVRTPAGADAAGLLDRGFGLWALRGQHWKLVHRFGSSDASGTSAPFVSGLAAVGPLVAATYSDGARFRLWLGGDDVPMPTQVPVDGDRAATIVAHGRQLLLVTDDDHAARAWLTTIPRPTQ